MNNSSDAKREILEEVAAGRLSPEQAAARLEAVERGTDAGGATATATEPPPTPARRVRIVRRAGYLEVVGDPAVADAAVEGPHRIRREGDVLVVEGSWPDGEGIWVEHSPRFNLRWKGDIPRLRVRVNPDVELELVSQAGSVQVRGVRAPIRVELLAGNAVIEGFASPIDLVVQAGSVRASGRLDSGASRVRCDAGSVVLSLSADSSVRVSGRSTLGKVSVDGVVGRHEGLSGSLPGVLIGAGAGTLEVETNLGEVRVGVEA